MFLLRSVTMRYSVPPSRAIVGSGKQKGFLSSFLWCSSWYFSISRRESFVMIHLSLGLTFDRFLYFVWMWLLNASSVLNLSQLALFMSMMLSSIWFGRSFLVKKKTWSYCRVLIHQERDCQEVFFSSGNSVIREAYNLWHANCSRSTTSCANSPPPPW